MKCLFYVYQVSLFLLSAFSLNELHICYMHKKMLFAIENIPSDVREVIYKHFDSQMLVWEQLALSAFSFFVVGFTWQMILVKRSELGRKCIMKQRENLKVQ